MGVDADLGLRVEHVPVGADPVADAVHGEPTAGVGDVDAVRAVGLHHPGLLGEGPRGRHVGHHQEAGHVHAQLACGGDVLGRHVRLRAVRGDAHRADPEGVGALELGDGADAGQQERGEDGVLDGVRGGFDPLPVGVAAGAVVEAAAGQAVAVGDLDRVHAGPVEGGGDLRHELGGDAVPDGVHAVPEGDVLDVEPAGHSVTSEVVRWAMRSATRRAAEVMMSRLPA